MQLRRWGSGGRILAAAWAAVAVVHLLMLPGQLHSASAAGVDRRQLQGNFICADFDDSGVINVNDLLMLLGMFGGVVANMAAAREFDLSGNGVIDVQDLLLMLGSFGGVCTREETAPVEPTWFDENGNPEVLATWGTAVDYCFAQGMELCSYADYCPDGGGMPPRGGVKRGDEWAPMADEPNRWVQVGVWGGSGANTCLAHDEVANGAHGDPGWGLDPSSHGFMGWVLCCPVGELATSCEDFPPTAVDVTFLSDYRDRSGNNRQVVHTGGTDSEIGPNGAHFDGNGDYITIGHFDYETDATFTVSFWFTKEGCTGGIYEYMFSDHASVDATMWDTPYLDIYIGCETSGGGWSTLGGTIVRYWMRDVAGTEAMMDWPMADAGSFDAVTSIWVHIALVVTPDSIMTYEDGTRVAEQQYGYYGSLPVALNAAAPSPHVLTPPFSGLVDGAAIFQFGNLHIGGRADQNDQRRFLGHLALLAIFEEAITAAHAACLFDQGMQALPHPGGTTTGFQDGSGAFTGWGAAVDYCISQGTSGVCPLATYCPNGAGGDPAGGRRPGDQWAPYLAPGRVNSWVQVGTMRDDPDLTCDPNGPQSLGDNTIHSDPVWAAEAVSHPFMGWIMCCTEETSGRCLAGADCGGQVLFSGRSSADCGVACPNICGEEVSTTCAELAGDQCVVGYQCPSGQWWDDADGVCAESQYECGGFGDTCIWAADTECDVVGDFDGASRFSYCDAGTDCTDCPNDPLCSAGGR